MYIRKATPADVPALIRLFERAKSIMRASGNMQQWGDGYPSAEVVRGDIERGVCYVACPREGSDIEATMALIPGPDPTYTHIEQGDWHDDEPYSVIHRIATLAPGRGYAKKLLDWAFGQTKNVRIDTHRDNVIMHHILQKYGFKHCGVIRLANGDPRDAYQLNSLSR